MRRGHIFRAIGFSSVGLALAGCAGWGGNVRGDFQCRAPQGTCAPTAEIDARAVRRLVRQAPDATLSALARTPRTVGSMPLGRTGERVLRIVFFPYIDAQGLLHDRAVVHAVVESSGWQDGPQATARADHRFQTGTGGSSAGQEGSGAAAPPAAPAHALRPDLASEGGAP